ncbi:MAG: hypothetical protein M3O26_11445 [Pseudomonadota bacterium]|nr:hypothetical protein [Pseudomonadota bacterium]
MWEYSDTEDGHLDYPKNRKCLGQDFCSNILRSRQLIDPLVGQQARQLRGGGSAK